MTPVLLGAGLLAICCCAPGCRSRGFQPHVINAPYREPAQVASAQEESPTIDSHLLDVLAEELDADAWQPNRDWSPLAVWNQRMREEEPHGEFRWRFHHLAAQQKLHELDGEATPTEIEHNYWPTSALLSLEQQGIKGDSAAIQYLRELSERNDRVGHNAAILLCQRTPSTCEHLASRLESIVRGEVESSEIRGQSIDEEEEAPSADVEENEEPAKTVPTRLSVSMRCAASEAWCRVLCATCDDVREALERAALLLNDPTLELTVRGELYCQLAQWMAPRTIPMLDSALQGSGQASRAPIEIRRAAVLACLQHAAWHDSILLNPSGPKGDSSWPETIWNARYDPDVTVRRYFVQWLSIVEESRIDDARSFEMLQSLTRDRDLLVQRDAIVGLGRLGTPQAVEELHRLLTRREEPIRETAIRGLCQRHVSEATRYIDDESVVVRRSLAASLAERPTTDSVRLLEQLIVDRDPSVQVAAVESCRPWPDQWAVPVLYSGLIDGYLSTRQNSFDQLQRRTDTVSTFPHEASRNERQQAARDFCDQQQLTPLIGRVHRPESAVDRANSPEARELQSNEVRQKWDAFREQTAVSLDGMNSLALFNADDVPALEQLLASSNAADQTLLLNVVLPEVSEEYAALKEMADAAVDVRRRGADRLAQLGGERRSLSLYVVRVLRERLLHEQDRIVWQRAFAAIVLDGTDEAAELALLALNHQWPDIRQLGCDFVVRHPHPSRGIWLLPLLDDPNANVQLAAIRATGLCQNPIVLDGPPVSGSSDAENGHVADVPSRGLRPLLSHAQSNVRNEATIAMSRLGDQQAIQVLMQMCRSPDSETRMHAIAAMAESRQSRFIEPLINLGWTESDAGVQHAILRALLELVPEERRPEKLSPVAPASDALKVWMDWWKLQSTRDTTSS
ncbi:MAG: HEAT repeat domain-containing protein [Planctomycetota bacterium]|nr:HEAT repeat domain-containing protein [Planctomycetota bacterium]MDA1211255.1 HEAT repeat domain-containing protein [Planctomycetota bacterium]